MELKNFNKNFVKNKSKNGPAGKHFWVFSSTISHNIYQDSLYFHEKVLKNVRLAQRYSEFPFPPGSMLHQVRKNYARQWRPRMTNQTCNQHWIKMQGVQVSLFLWLIVHILKTAFWMKNLILNFHKKAMKYLVIINIVTNVIIS